MKNTLLSTGIVLACALAWGCSQKEESLTIAFSNDMDGEIRSCGCASKDFGGLGRRATFLRDTRKTSNQLILLEGGDFFGTDINYSQEKASLTMQSMAFMRYDGIVLGENELSHGIDYLLERVTALKLPVVAANLHDAETDTLLFAPSRVLRLPTGLRIGLVGVLGTGVKLPLPETSRPVRVGPPQVAVEREVGSIRDKVDLVIVLAHMPLGAARKLAENNLDVDLVVAGHDARPIRRMRRFGNAFVLQSANRGRYVGVARATVKRKEGIIDLVASLEVLDVDYEDHEAIVKLFQAYDMEIANQERARVTSSVPSGEHIKNRFTAGEACRPCHTDIYDHWQDTQHGHAFATLQDKERQYDRDCTPCHTTGFYQIGGFLSIQETPGLVNVQCEACHGNGREHARNPELETEGTAHLMCKTCHTEDQSPGFQFPKWWARIKHPPPADMMGGGR
ncbi:MAG: multiheme c-type cytochrome [Candidatus Krumholzibacteriia bacterium]